MGVCTVQLKRNFQHNLQVSSAENDARMWFVHRLKQSY